MKLDIKVLGPGCAKCKTTYQNVVTALAETGVEATLTKIEDLEEMMRSAWKWQQNLDNS